IVNLRQQGRRGAVATIVNVRGSVPSFETAKMLIRDDGSIVGTVGGGCVEAEVWQAAREVMESEKPRTLTFNLNQSPKYDTGLVCGGTLCRNDRVKAQNDHYLSRAGEGRNPREVVRTRACAGWTRHRRDHSRRNCGRHHCRIDRGAPARGASAAAHELVPLRKNRIK